jgi:hypothetical protein
MKHHQPGLTAHRGGKEEVPVQSVNVGKLRLARYAHLGLMIEFEGCGVHAKDVWLAKVLRDKFEEESIGQ